MKIYIKPKTRTLSFPSESLMEGTMTVDPDKDVSTNEGTGGWTRGFWDWDYEAEE